MRKVKRMLLLLAAAVTLMTACSSRLTDLRLVWDQLYLNLGDRAAYMSFTSGSDKSLDDFCTAFEDARATFGLGGFSYSDNGENKTFMPGAENAPAVSGIAYGETTFMTYVFRAGEEDGKIYADVTLICTMSGTAEIDGTVTAVQTMPVTLIANPVHPEASLGFKLYAMKTDENETENAQTVPVFCFRIYFERFGADFKAVSVANNNHAGLAEISMGSE
ncbi:MAG: hypothetical protein LBS99_02635 [Clostridiales bacterium]|jgi:hypothetical protein|nr:hypothetical protein [Clostridiales bacterium]